MRLSPLSFVAALVFALIPVAASAQTLMLYPGETLTQLRAGFTTHLLKNVNDSGAPPAPPSGISLINYPAPLGENAAYITDPPPGAKKSPAIIWLVGGFDNSIGDVWTPQPASDDQSASAFRQAGVVTMYPSLRGGNNNPGYIENFYGEVSDVIAAEQYLKNLSYVDPDRIYLGGHSTGGTLAMLVAESSSTFRAIFAFGPVDHIGGYGAENFTFDYNNKMELALRAPVYCLDSISTPTFVFEGMNAPSNITPLTNLSGKTDNPACHFYEIPGYDHFSELAAFTPIIASEIAADKGATPKFTFLHVTPKVIPAPQE